MFPRGGGGLEIGDCPGVVEVPGGSLWPSIPEYVLVAMKWTHPFQSTPGGWLGGDSSIIPLLRD